ncbi:TPA: hypothetical protein ACJF1S_004691, partial [Salmonella enterica subsp. enterica serovar Liverpool]
TVHDTIPKRKRLIGQFHLFMQKPVSVSFLQGGRMNDCPRRYTRKKAAYRSVSPLHKTRFGGFLLIRPVKGIEVAEDASVTIRQLIDSRGDIILFVFVMRNTKLYGLRSF